MKKVVIVLLTLAILLLVGILGYRYWIITYCVLDWDIMENPDYINNPDNVEMLDGDFTYVDNQALLDVIVGTWVSQDEQYEMNLDNDCRIVISQDGEVVLEDTLQFIYLQPGKVEYTDFTLESWAQEERGKMALGEITNFFHKSDDGSGKIVLEVVQQDGSSQTIEFQKQ